MLCEQCGENPATVHMTKIINNHKMEAHLCSECARSNSELQPGFDIPSILSSMLEQPKVWGSVSPKEKACPTCNLSIGDIRKLNQLGCSDCYQTFRQELEPLLRRVQGNTKHIGKVPETTYAKVKLSRKVKDLREQLQTSINEEKYEEAAKLRDKIRKLEKDINSVEEGGSK